MTKLVVWEYHNQGKGLRKAVVGLLENKKGGIASTFFAPNLTMNLTYLCYGNTKVGLTFTQFAKTRQSARFIDEMHTLTLN